MPVITRYDVVQVLDDDRSEAVQVTTFGTTRKEGLGIGRPLVDPEAAEVTCIVNKQDSHHGCTTPSTWNRMRRRQPEKHHFRIMELVVMSFEHYLKRQEFEFMGHGKGNQRSHQQCSWISQLFLESGS